MAKPDYIASDAHLGAVPDVRERAFLQFLNHAGANAGTLLINGDLFDFWFEYGAVIPGKHFRVLAALAALVDAGIQVTLMGGNHDAWGGRFLREEVGVAFHTGILRTSLAGKPALVAHGDGLGKGDLRYRALKSVVRNRAVIGLFRAIHPEIGLRIATALSRTETRQDDAVLRGRAHFLEHWGKSRLDEDPSLHWVVCGHAHLPACVPLGNGRFYLNAGDWIRHNSYIVISPQGEPALHYWPQD
ncbi:MAG: UDP-2,3-diacylglucosamine diphosphatase [Longimicrobiales bacterium]